MFGTGFLKVCAQSHKDHSDRHQHTGLWLCNCPFMDATKHQAIAHLREWGCRIVCSTSDVSRTPFIGQMRLVTDDMSSWKISCKWDLYSVAMLSQIHTDDWRMEEELVSLFTGRSSWVQTPQCIWWKKTVWTDLTRWRKQQAGNDPQAHSLEWLTWINMQLPKSVYYAFLLYGFKRD